MDKQLQEMSKIKAEVYDKTVFDGFSIGQKVWIIDTEYTQSPCHCDNGMVTAVFNGKDIKIRCPDCDGKKIITTKKYVARDMEITCLVYEINDQYDSVATFTKAYLNHDVFSKCNIDQLYHTENECQLEVDRLNKCEEYGYVRNEED